MFTSEQEKENFRKGLEEKGEIQVRENLALGIYGNEERKSYAELWLAQVERNNQNTERQQEKLKEDERFQAQLLISKSQAESAKLSARTAMIAAGIAVISTIISLAPMFHK